MKKLLNTEISEIKFHTFSARRSKVVRPSFFFLLSRLQERKIEKGDETKNKKKEKTNGLFFLLFVCLFDGRAGGVRKKKRRCRMSKEVDVGKAAAGDRLNVHLVFRSENFSREEKEEENPKQKKRRREGTRKEIDSSAAVGTSTHTAHEWCRCVRL